MNEFLKISIVTPCFNQVNFIEETILSLLDQNYPNLEYIIIDGGSTDGTADIIRKYAHRIQYWISEKDDGLYDALQKGLKLAGGEIMGWLNSDDLLHRNSLFTLNEIFSSFTDLNWLQGYPTVADELGRFVYHRKPRSSKYSFYAGDYRDGIFIQQESTYWRKSLWDQAGGYISTAYRYASDFELWMRFFKYADLFETGAFIGSFRIREGQLSAANHQSYMKECDQIIKNCLAGLSSEELHHLHRLTRSRNLGKKFPFLQRFGLLNRGFEQTRNAMSIHYDFQKKRFTRVI